MSLFNLPTTTEELKGANNGISEVQYMQVSADKPIKGDNFSGGKIDFRFSVSGDKWWVPAKSYVYMDVSLQKGDGSGLELKDDVAANQGLCANLFSSAEFIINGTTVCSVTDNLAQCEALEHRMTKSNSITKTLSKSTNFWDKRFIDRQTDIIDNKKLGVQRTTVLNRLALGFDAAVTVAVTAATGAVVFSAASSKGVVFSVGDIIEINNLELIVRAVTSATQLTVQTGIISADIAAAVIDFSRIRRENTEARNAPNTELCWQPLSLGIFKIEHGLPCGDYTLRLTPFPNTVYPIRAFESSELVKSAGVGVDNIKLNVNYMYFYCHTLKGDRVDNKNYLIDLENINCQRTAISSATFEQNDFTIEPSTYGIACAYQHQNAGNDTRFSASKFKAVNNEELNLKRFFIQYDGQKYPQIDADNEFKAGVDRTIQRYYETMHYNGGAHDVGGCEDIQTYHDNGQYFYFAVPKDGSSRATRLNVHQNFSALTVNPNLLVFSYYRSVCQVQIEDGRVVQVQIENN
jgi:hypothetical protein